ncbi:unknown [Firmicutes bacterium CAG:321]|nr:unknown [Firmicutes bacterium CAG:321]
MNLIINTPTDNIGIKKFNEVLAELQKELILFYIKDLQIDMESKEKILAFIKLELKKQSKE